MRIITDDLKESGDIKVLQIAGGGTSQSQVDDKVVVTVPGSGGGGGTSSFDSLTAAFGLKVMNAMPYHCSVTSTPGSGELFANGIYLTGGTTYTNLFICSAGTSVGLTLAQLAIYNSSYQLVANTANDTSMGSTPGYVKEALTSPYTPSASGLFYLAGLVTGTTIGSWLSTGGSAIVGKPITGSILAAWLQTSQTSLPATATPLQTASLSLWMAAN